MAVRRALSGPPMTLNTPPFALSESAHSTSTCICYPIIADSNQNTPTAKDTHIPNDPPVPGLVGYMHWRPSCKVGKCGNEGNRTPWTEVSMAPGIIQTGEFAFCLGTMFGSIQGYFCSESIPGGALGIIYIVPGIPTRVGCVQGKCLTRSMICPAPEQRI